MLDFFKQLSLKRSAWIFLAFTAFALESTALYFLSFLNTQLK